MPDLYEIDGLRGNRMRANRITIIVSMVVAGFSVLTAAGLARAAEYGRATVYYHDWDIELRGALSVDDVRTRFHVRTDVRDLDDVHNLMGAFPTTWMAVPAGHQSIDVRLVIDFYEADGSVVTYYASHFHLYSGDGSKRASIDEPFKDRFRALTMALVR